jgi:Holliday junction resolvase RusA-like endonuclease
MLKMEKEYNELYGDIPFDSLDRVEYLLQRSNLSRSRTKVYDEMKRINSLKWKTISYTIYLIPKATPRPRSGKNGIFYVKGASDNKKFFKNYVKDQDIPLIVTPTKFYCTSYLPIPKSMNSVEKILAEMGFIYPTSKPDWDNLAKAYCDMIQDLLLYDDSLVVEGSSKKRYSIKPRIEITIKYLEDFDAQFNKNKILKKGMNTDESDLY